MRELIYNTWNSIMDSNINPLSNIPDLETRHMVMQVLAWMWCIIFAAWSGATYYLGVSIFYHSIILFGLFVTVGTFKLASSSEKGE